MMTFNQYQFTKWEWKLWYICKIFKFLYFTLEYYPLKACYIDNLCRLSLVEIPYGKSFTNITLYEPLENHSILIPYKQKIKNINHKVKFERKIIRLTNFGKQFIQNVVADN